MRRPYDTVVIIYNPNSTGNSRGNAERLKKELKHLDTQLTVTLKATTHAGHAEEIGARYAKKDQPVLLVSASGDGGYHELVNGILSGDSKEVYAVVLPSGNANDHAAELHQRDIAEMIARPKRKIIDTIEVHSTINGRPWQRVAHSYVGLGLTAHIGKKLTEAKLNPLNEKWLVVKYLLHFSHVTLLIDGHRERYSSIVFGNIGRMSKLLKLGKPSLHDDSFEVYITRYRSLGRALLTLLLASTVGMQATKTTKKFEFTTTKATDIQLDGEVHHLDSDSTVIVKTRPNSLRTIE